MGQVNEEARAKAVEYWAPPDLRDQVAALAAAAGKGPSSLTPDDLAEFDQLHAEGADVTLRLAEKVGVSTEDHVLDVGCGLGGPARLLANTHGCRVTGIDLTPAYIETAEFFNELTGISDKVSFQVGDATDLKFADGTFDVVWSQHAAQSIPEKPAYFSEMARVLKPGGALVLHDLYRGDVDVGVVYPSAWADDESGDFLAPLDSVRSLIESNGLVVDSWVDVTDEAKRWTEAVIEALSSPAGAEEHASAIPGLDFTLLFDLDRALSNMVNSITDIESGAVGFFEAIARKPSEGR